MLCLHNIFTHLLFAQPKSGTLDISVKSNEEMYSLTECIRVAEITNRKGFWLLLNVLLRRGNLKPTVTVSNETESSPAYHTTKGSAYQRKAELFFSSKFVKTLNKFYTF